MDYFSVINTVIQKQIYEGRNTNFVIYPFGKQGLLVKQILNDRFNIEEKFIIDNGLAKVNKRIKTLDDLSNIDCAEYTFLICSDNEDYYNEIRESIRKYVSPNNIVDIFPKTEFDRKIEAAQKRTKVGKYSYGPLCNHLCVEQVGAFSCFAAGTDVVGNHPINYISTHSFLYLGNINVLPVNYEDCEHLPQFFPNVTPKGKTYKLNKITIGNDVWLGRNVIITNSANIGNGVIAAAGAIITKDVPDYAVVMGVPARIVRYRYTLEQIEKLNKIAWWNWSDEKIRECYDDFYEHVEIFIKKHENNK